MATGPISRAEVEELHQLSPSERVAALQQLGQRVAHGASDTAVVDALLALASSETATIMRDAWLGYIFASSAKEFFPLLEEWIHNPDEERRVGIVGAMAWNRSPEANDALLRLIQSDSSSKVRRRALRALVRRGSLGKWKPFDITPLVSESDWLPVTRREYSRLLESQRVRRGRAKGDES